MVPPSVTTSSSRHDEINRIYDVYLPNEAFEHFETFMQGVFGELEPKSTISISGLLRHIGSHLKTGILATAAKEEIAVYCPAVPGLDDRPPGPGSFRRPIR